MNTNNKISGFRLRIASFRSSTIRYIWITLADDNYQWLDDDLGSACGLRLEESIPTRLPAGGEELPLNRRGGCPRPLAGGDFHVYHRSVTLPHEMFPASVVRGSPRGV